MTDKAYNTLLML